MDRNAREEALRSQSRAFRSVGTTHGATFNIVESPVSMASEDSRLLQITDFCSNAILRGHRPAPNKDDKFLLNPILQKFDTDGSERHGFLHVSKSMGRPSTSSNHP